jgi:hypothetical protein
MRRVLFAAGVAAGVVCLIAVMACLFVRFPMVFVDHGRYLVNPRRNMVMSLALFTGLISIVLALFGSGLQRVLLIAADVALLAFWYSAWMLRF